MLSLNHQLVRPKKNLKYTQVKRTYSVQLNNEKRLRQSAFAATTYSQQV